MCQTRLSHGSSYIQTSLLKTFVEKVLIRILLDIDPFPKRHKLVRNGGFPKFEALYYSLNMVNSTETS